MGDIKKKHYKERCHNPCYLEGVSADIIGDPILMGCAAMNGNNCKECGCHYSLHMHVYYETTTVETKIKNETVVWKLATQEDVIKAQRNQICLLEKRKAEYMNEHKEITTALATFSFFLCNNSICPINDAYEDYLNVLIQNAKRKDSLESSIVDRYESLKKEYIEEKRQITEAAKLAKAQNITHVNSNQILKTYKRLINLSHSGKTINKLHKIFKQGRHNEQIKNMQYVHTKIFQTPIPSAVKIMPKKQKSENPETAENAMNVGQDTKNTAQLPIEYDNDITLNEKNQLIPMEDIKNELCQIAYTDFTAQGEVLNDKNSLSVIDSNSRGGETKSDNTENSNDEISLSDMQQYSYIAKRRVQVQDEPPKLKFIWEWLKTKLHYFIPESWITTTVKTDTKNIH